LTQTRDGQAVVELISVKCQSFEECFMRGVVVLCVVCFFLVLSDAKVKKVRKVRKVAERSNVIEEKMVQMSEKGTSLGGVEESNSDGQNHITINNVNILLPYQMQTPYRLIAHGGCFRWKSKNEDLVVVRPVSSGVCSNEADISIASSFTFDHRRSTWIEVSESERMNVVMLVVESNFSEEQILIENNLLFHFSSFSSFLFSF
jgi:hypothetical protein